MYDYKKHIIIRPEFSSDRTSNVTHNIPFYFMPWYRGRRVNGVACKLVTLRDGDEVDELAVTIILCIVLVYCTCLVTTAG